MTALARAKMQVANDGPFMPSPPRVAPIVRLSKPPQGHAQWWIPLGFLMLLIGVAGGASLNHSLPPLLPVSFSIQLPDVRGMVAALIPHPDPEATEPYAETMTPPPADVVVPIPIVSALPPSLEKIVGNNVDTSAGIALPASSLQVPDPDPIASDAPKAMPVDPAVAAVADAISDAPALAKEAKPQSGAQIEVHNAGALDVGHLIDEAQMKLDSGDDKGALALYDRILAHDHANRVALAGQAFSAQRAGRYEVAVSANRRLLALDPRDDTARSNLATALGGWDTPQALKELQRLAEAKPDFAPTQVALAEGLARRGNVLGALPYARHASGLEPDNVYYRLDLAVIYDNLGHSGEAIRLYQQVLRACDALDGQAPVLPVSQAAIRQRVGYLEMMMASAENIAAQQ